MSRERYPIIKPKKGFIRYYTHPNGICSELGFDPPYFNGEQLIAEIMSIEGNLSKKILFYALAIQKELILVCKCSDGHAREISFPDHELIETGDAVRAFNKLIEIAGKWM